MDLGFAAGERILWPASVLAGVAMYGAVSRFVQLRLMTGFPFLKSFFLLILLQFFFHS